MKPILTALVTLSLTAGAALAQSIDMSSMTPVLTYPDPTPETVTQDDTAVDR